jgi:hypothetical protein
VGQKILIWVREIDSKVLIEIGGILERSEIHLIQAWIHGRYGELNGDYYESKSIQIRIDNGAKEKCRKSWKVKQTTSRRVVRKRNTPKIGHFTLVLTKFNEVGKPRISKAKTPIKKRVRWKV